MPYAQATEMHPLICLPKETYPKHLPSARPVLTTEKDPSVYWRRQTINSEKPELGHRGRVGNYALKVGKASRAHSP